MLFRPVTPCSNSREL